MLARTLSLAPLLLWTACASAPSRTADDIPHQVTSTLSAQHQQHIVDAARRLMLRDNVPGLQMSAAWPDGQTLTLAMGHVDEAATTPMTSQHVLQVGSTSKLLTAVLVLRAVEQKRLTLDAKLSTWFAGFPKADVIDVRMLLQHRTGFAEVLQKPSKLVSSTLSQKEWVLQEVIADMMDDDLAFTPGTRFQYCNTNYVVLGGILEKVHGKPFHQVLHDEVVTPLALTSTWMPPGPPLHTAVAHGVDVDFMPFGPHWMDGGNPSWTTLASSAGGLMSTSSDLVRVMRAWATHQLLSSTMTAQMMRLRDLQDPPEATMTGYGLGVSGYTLGTGVDAVDVKGHRGGIMGFDSTPVCTVDGACVVVLLNHSRMDSHTGLDLAHQVLRLR